VYVDNFGTVVKIEIGLQWIAQQLILLEIINVSFQHHRYTILNLSINRAVREWDFDLCRVYT